LIPEKNRPYDSARRATTSNILGMGFTNSIQVGCMVSPV
jgi:hypothetical protein